MQPHAHPHQQQPTRAKEGLCPRQTLLWGWGVGRAAVHTAPKPGTGSMWAGEFASPKSCPFLFASLAVARVMCLGGAGSRAAAGRDVPARALPGACSSGISAQVPRQTPLAHPCCPGAQPRDAEPGEPSRLAVGNWGLGKACEARAQAARTAPQVAFWSLDISSCDRTWRVPGSQWHRSQTVNRWVLPAWGSVTSQPMLPGIFVTFTELRVWGQIDHHCSEGSSPLQWPQPQLGLSIPEIREAACMPFMPSLPCRALSPPSPADRPQQQSPQAEPVGHPWCPSPWHMACPPPPRRVAQVQSCAGNRAGSWGRQPEHKSVQRLFLILSEAWPMQGRDRGGLPAFPGGAGGHSGLRKRRVAPTRWVGGGRVGRVCGAQGRRRAVPRHYRQPRAPVVLYFPLQAPALEGAAMLLPLLLGGLGWEEGWEQGAVPAFCSWTPAGTTEGMCKKIRGALVPEGPGEISREKAPTDSFFPTPSCANLSHPCGSQPGCKHLSGHPSSTESQNSLGVSHTQHPHPWIHPWAGRDGMFWGIAGTSLT